MNFELSHADLADRQAANLHQKQVNKLNFCKNQGWAWLPEIAGPAVLASTSHPKLTTPPTLSSPKHCIILEENNEHIEAIQWKLLVKEVSLTAIFNGVDKTTARV